MNGRACRTGAAGSSHRVTEAFTAEPDDRRLCLFDIPRTVVTELLGDYQIRLRLFALTEMSLRNQLRGACMTNFFVLGPLECRSAERPVNISGTLKRALLATLLAAEGNPLSVESLVTELWADSPPPQWENALQAHVSRL